MESQERQATVQLALAQIVGDFGRKVSDDPVRLRNLMVDATGVNAMTLGSEIDAVVAAAENQLPDTVLLGDETQQLEATQRLAAVLGPDQAELAGWATETWSTVLNSAPAARPGATLTGATAGATALPDATIGAATVMSDATVVGGDTVQMAPTGDGTPPSDEPADKRQMMVIGGFVGLLVLVVIVILATRGGGDDKPESATSTVPTGADTTVVTGDPEGPTSTQVDGGGPVAPIAQVTTPLSVANGVTGERAIVPGDASTTIELTFTNTSTEAFDGYWIEVVPATFGRSGLDVAQLGAVDIGDAGEQAFGVPVQLAAGETGTVAYTTPWVPTDAAEVDRTAGEFDRELQAWITKHGDPRTPSLTLTSAETSTTEIYDLVGSTDPGNALSINGQSLNMGPDGAFVVEVRLDPGANTFEIVATSPLGVDVSRVGTVTYQPPVPETTAPPANRAPVLDPECADAYLVFEGQFEFYRFGLPEGCFPDPDGDPVLIYSDLGEGAVGECGEGNACWVYQVPADWDGTPMEVTATIWAQDSNGAESERTSYTMCLNC